MCCRREQLYITVFLREYLAPNNSLKSVLHHAFSCSMFTWKTALIRVSHLRRSKPKTWVNQRIRVWCILPLFTVFCAFNGSTLSWFGGPIAMIVTHVTDRPEIYEFAAFDTDPVRWKYKSSESTPKQKYGGQTWRKCNPHAASACAWSLVRKKFKVSVLRHRHDLQYLWLIC